MQLHSIACDLRKIGRQFSPGRDVVSRCLCAQEGGGFSDDLVQIETFSIESSLLELRADSADNVGSTLCIPCNPGDSRAHSIEIGFIVPELSQAGIGVGHGAADRLTQLMSQGCR